MSDYIVCAAEELPPGARRLIPAGPWGIGVFNCGGELIALTNRCPHAGAPVCRGVVTGTTRAVGDYEVVWEQDRQILRCPWHGWEFSLRTGKTVSSPVRSIKTYPVRVDGGNIVVELEDADD